MKNMCVMPLTMNANYLMLLAVSTQIANKDKFPNSVDMPELEAIIVENNEPNGPFGAKEVGEGAIMPTIPAILNAIYDATGVYVDELPVTPEKVLKAIREKSLQIR